MNKANLKTWFAMSILQKFSYNSGWAVYLGGGRFNEGVLSISRTCFILLYLFSNALN